ncbi:hypothetical protein FTO68_00655 [Methanocalculus taiwanensis]|uniref:DUF4352 domain-containing protein n=1 Tax=Methanocalculus taiwanensis TaxID=106207 RepID=A0ABD4TI51_9EURY|nr:hypothetical protein [Methanocalculus taiwanensis]MCQ1537505.1 hypothetical protein [Methanocalculus taiwanensis]
MKDNAVVTFDFMIGFTIFIISFILVAAMIPHTLFSVQSSRIDFDAVAYRTGVILTEDPGMPASPVFPVWEQVSDPGDVIRIGLAVEQGSANILSKGKVDRFFEGGFFTYPDDHRRALLFGDYPYSCNVTLTMMDDHSIRSVGPPPPDLYGTVRRVVVVKEPSYLIVDGLVHSEFLVVENETPNQRFSVEVTMDQLLDRSVDPVFSIDPRTDLLQIEIRNFGEYLNVSAPHATLVQIIISRAGVPITYSAYSLWLDGEPATLPGELTDSLFFTLSPVPEPPWRSTDAIGITFVFDDDPPASLMTGTHLYDYQNATLPDPDKAILEVAVW